MAAHQRFVVVSLGSIGRRHLTNLRALKPDAEIAVCRLHGVQPDGDIPEGCDVVLHGIDEAIEFQPYAAIIAGPASTHVDIAIALAGAHIHLLIEKPLAVDSSSAMKLTQEINNAGVIATVGYNLRFMPGLQEIKRLVDSGRIGRVISVRSEVGQYLPDWRPNQDYRQSVSANADLGGGALLELSHEFDYLNWLFGLPDRIVASGGKCGSLEIDVEDLVEVVMSYDSPRMLVSVHLDFLDRSGFRALRLIGELGTICWDATRDDVSVFDSSTDQWQTVDAEQLDDRNELYRRELQYFFQQIENGDDAQVGMRQACETLMIVDAARASMAAGKTIELGLNVE